MSQGDYIEVIEPDNEYVGCRGYISGLTREGMLVVQLEGQRGPSWEVSFSPFDIDLVQPVTWWWQQSA